MSEAIEGLRGRRVHVVGASGAEGTALLLYLVGERGLTGVVAHDFSDDMRAFARSFRRANTAWDRKEREARLGRLRRLPVEFRLGGDYLRGLTEAEVVYASQNWFNYPANLPAIPDAVAAGAKLQGVVDLAMSLFPGTRIGVTGSNGKSTTSALTRCLLQGWGADRPVLQGGNDRARQVDLARLASAAEDELLIWEVSNRHLRDRSVPVDVAVLTNVTRNHIEDHGSWEAYRAAKARLVLGVGEAGHAVLTATDPVSRELAEAVRSTGATLWWAGRAPDERSPAEAAAEGCAWVDRGRVLLRRPGEAAATEVGPIEALPLPGAHNVGNLLSAVCAAVAAGARPGSLEDALARLSGLAGRLELVAEHNGVRWRYDIQATTAPAAEAGILAIGRTGRPVLLIVGGEDKGMDYRGMADAAADHAVGILALPGSGAEAFLAALDARVPAQRADSVEAAIALALRSAEPGTTVLLSPGCAFFHSRFLDAGPSYAARVRAALDAEGPDAT